MATWISPRHSNAQSTVPKDLSLDEKIEIVIARVEGWWLEVACEMIRKDMARRRLAILHIVTGCFEMKAKFQKGCVGKGESRSYFNAGIRLIFPEASTWPKHLEKEMIK